MKTWTPIFLSFLLFSGCLQDSTGPAGFQEPIIRLAVTGGIAGVDYQILVDGPRREVVGERCVNGCAFQEGELLHGLTREQARYLAELFRGAGIHQLAGTDFGTQCCDQFHYQITYSDGEGVSALGGSSETLPPDLRQAVATVAAYAQGVVPAVVAMASEWRDWPGDPVILEAWEVIGDVARFQVAYSGGCASHHFDLVAYGGWKESDPVQVTAGISHDSNGDTCEALLTDTLTFDLQPIKQAYQETYGESEPGGATLIIGLEHAVSFSSLYPIPLTYTF